MTEGSPQTIIEKEEQVDLPPILMLLKAKDRNHPLEMQELFIVLPQTSTQATGLRARLIAA